MICPVLRFEIKGKNRYAKKKNIQLQNLPISKMNCADSTERSLKLPEPVFHCVDIFHHQPDNIDVPAGIPAHEVHIPQKQSTRSA